jgi:hypothetical protein
MGVGVREEDDDDSGEEVKFLRTLGSRKVLAKPHFHFRQARALWGPVLTSFHFGPCGILLLRRSEGKNGQRQQNQRGRTPPIFFLVQHSSPFLFTNQPHTITHTHRQHVDLQGTILTIHQLELLDSFHPRTASSPAQPTS